MACSVFISVDSSVWKVHLTRLVFKGNQVKKSTLLFSLRFLGNEGKKVKGARGLNSSSVWQTSCLCARHKLSVPVCL